MSQHQYVKHINKELRRINEIIDFKILHGLSYREETRKHKELLNQMNMFKVKKPSFSLFNFFF